MEPKTMPNIRPIAAFIVCIDKGKVFYDRHDIDDRLGSHIFDRRTSNVIDPDAVFAEYLFNLFCFFFEHGLPFGTIVCDFDLSCHMFSSLQAGRCGCI